MPHLPRHLVLVPCYLLFSCLISCTGGEATIPPGYEASPMVNMGSPDPDPMMGGEEPIMMGGEEPIMMGGEEPIMMGGEPMPGAIEPPVAGVEPVEPDCDPLNPISVGLFVTGDTSPSTTLVNCGGCHVGGGGSAFNLSADINAPTPLNFTQISSVYDSLAYYVSPGAGADSPLVSRMSDDHGNNYTSLPVDDPSVVAMIAWIDSFCE